MIVKLNECLLQGQTENWTRKAKNEMGRCFGPGHCVDRGSQCDKMAMNTEVSF